MDVRDLTIRDLAKLAADIRAAAPGSRKATTLTSRMASAAAYLADSGALQQMQWWFAAEPEAPPGHKAEVVEFSRPPEKTKPYLLL